MSEGRDTRAVEFKRWISALEPEIRLQPTTVEAMQCAQNGAALQPTKHGSKALEYGLTTALIAVSAIASVRSRIIHTAASCQYVPAAVKGRRWA